MAEKRDITPEKQLLNLIEDPKGRKDNTFQAQKVKQSALNLFSPLVWVSRFSFFSKKLKGADEPRSRILNFKLINFCLIVCILGLIGYFTYSLYLGVVGLRKDVDLGVGTAVKVRTDIFGEVSILKKSATHYLGKVRKRNLFRIGGSDSVDLGRVFAPILATRLIDEIKHLRLVGISWSEDPDAMIEDANTGRTFFVKRGDMVDKFKVEAIFKDKIILGYGGEEVELK